MMKTFIFFIISLLLSLAAIGQQEDDSSDSVTVKSKFFSGISVTADIGKLGLGQLVDYEDKQAYSAHLLFFDKLQLSAEYGRGTLIPEQAFDNVTYESQGDYLRYGVDYNIKIDTKNFLSVGVRKASAEYSDKGTVLIKSASNLSDDYLRTFSRNSLSANWWEFVIVTETKLTPIIKKEEMNFFNKMLDNFYFGLTYRIRFLLDYEAQEGIDTYSIPGYGRTFDNSTPAVNLFLKYRIGL